MTLALPKTIQIFLPDGDPRSVRIAEITSRTVQAVQVPRALIDRAAGRDEIRQVGVYFLFGEADEGALPKVYIGEAEDCWVRLGQHRKDGSKEYWTQAVVVTSKTHKFDKGQGRWLEWFCTREAVAAQRYLVTNQSAAKEPHLTEPLKADLHDHFATLRILLATLGFPVFQAAAEALPPVPPTPEISPSDGEDSDGGLVPDPLPPVPLLDAELEVVKCEHKEGSARGAFTSEGFVVFAGSRARGTLTKKSEGTSFARARARLIEDGTLASDGDALRFTKDYLFRTPSGAGSVVLGRSANGFLAWKDASGQTLAERRGQGAP